MHKHTRKSLPPGGPWVLGLPLSRLPGPGRVEMAELTIFFGWRQIAVALGPSVPKAEIAGSSAALPLVRRRRAERALRTSRAWLVGARVARNC